MKKLISLCVSISLLISFSAPLQAKGHSSKGKSSSSASSSKKRSSTPKQTTSSKNSCPANGIKDSTVQSMLKNPNGADWKDYNKMEKMSDFVEKHPEYKTTCRSQLIKGVNTATRFCSTYVQTAVEKDPTKIKFCGKDSPWSKLYDIMVAVGVQSGLTSVYNFNPNTQQYEMQTGNGSSQDGVDKNKNVGRNSNQGSEKSGQGGNGGDNTNIEQKVEEKVDDAKDDNKDNVLVLKFKHSVDTSFMVFGGKGKLSKQEEEWIKLLNEASSLNADIKNVLTTAVDMYVNPSKYSSASKGVPAYVMQFLFMKYADLAESVEDLMPYVNYKCNGGKPDRCQQIRSFASEAVLMQLRFRDNFDEDGRGSLVDKYLIPECEKLKDEATGKSVFRGDTDNASAALDEAQKKCVQAKMRAYILVKGKKTVQRELETEFEAKLRNVKFQNTQANQAFSPLFVYLLAGYLSMSGTVSTATTAAVTKASITAYTTVPFAFAKRTRGGGIILLFDHDLVAPEDLASDYIVTARRAPPVFTVVAAVVVHQRALLTIH